jgi:hypothetical protein
MIYTHILNNSAAGLRSPMELLPPAPSPAYTGRPAQNFEKLDERSRYGE